MRAEKVTPLRVIRQKCLDCCCFVKNEVKLCTSYGCPLHEFRFGKYPRKSAYFTHKKYEKPRSSVGGENSNG